MNQSCSGSKLIQVVLNVPRYGCTVGFRDITLTEYQTLQWLTLISDESIVVCASDPGLYGTTREDRKNQPGGLCRVRQSEPVVLGSGLMNPNLTFKSPIDHESVMLEV